jgi:hypothetical protein
VLSPVESQVVFDGVKLTPLNLLRRNAHISHGGKKPLPGHYIQIGANIRGLLLDNGARPFLDDLL